MAISDSNKSDDEIIHIEISHARTRTPEEPLAEAEHAILRSELGKLMRIARIARPGVIYEESAAAQTFSGGELMDVLEKGDGISGNEEKEVSEGGKKEDLWNMRGFPNSCVGYKRVRTRRISWKE